MKKSFVLITLLLAILISYQNCGRIKNGKDYSRVSSASVENGYYIVTSVDQDPEPDHHVIDISEYRDEDYLSVARAAIQAHENQVSYKSWMKSFYAEAQAVTCGSVITSSVNVSGTLDCSSYNGKYGLIIYGQNVNFNGGNSKFKLIFPQGKVGILVYGENAEVRNVEVNGMTNGMGILLYDSHKGRVRESQTNNNLIGITAYAENVANMNQVRIEDNEAKNNALFGIRVNSDWSAGKKVQVDKLEDNDLSGNQYYALHIRTQNMDFDSNSYDNKIAGSTNGWYLTGGTFQFQNLNLTGSDFAVTKTQIFVAEASQISLSSVQLMGGGGNSLQEAYGLHAYKTQNVNVNNSNIQNFNVGIKVATDGGVNSNINISSGSITNNTFAAVMLQGYDSTQLCPNVNNVYYSGNGYYNLWKVSGSNFCN